LQITCQLGTAIGISEMEITGPMLQATLITGNGATAGKLQTTHPTVPIWCPMIPISFDPL